MKTDRQIEFENWIDTFIDEKGLDLDHEFEVYDDHENVHFIDLAYLVTLMKGAGKREHAQIQHKVAEIDFKNGDVMHFFRFLCVAYVKHNYA